MSILSKYSKKAVQGPLKRLAERTIDSIEDKIENSVDDFFTKALKKTGLSSAVSNQIASRFGDSLKKELADKYFKKSTSAQDRITKKEICEGILPKSIETNRDSVNRITNSISVEGTSNVYQYPSQIGKYYISFKFSEYTRTTPQSQSKLKFKNAIVLPIPANLKESFNININEAATDVIGGVADVIQNSASGGNSAIKDNSAALAYSLLASKGGLGASSIASNVPLVGSPISSLISAAAPVAGSYLGSIPNPHMAVFFNGVSMRRHSFTWTFNPRNADESKAIKEIIDKLKQNSLPAFSPLGTAVLQYPYLCQISLEPWSKNGDELIKFKPALLQEPIINYSPNGIPSFFEGTNQPTFIELTLSFIETEYFTSNDFGRSGRTSEEGDKLSRVIEPVQDKIASFADSIIDATGL